MAGQYTYPNVTIYSNRLVLTDVPIMKVQAKQTGHINVLEHKRVTLSENGRKSIKRFLSAWFDCWYLSNGIFIPEKRYELFFYTLTLPSTQIHCDNVINKECLQEYLKEVQRMWGGRYFWVSERQKNGNIHYHILHDRNIEKMAVRRIWNAKVNRLGYVDRYQAKMKDRYKNGFWYDKNYKASIETQYKRYQYGQSTDWKSPNSTDKKPIEDHKGMTNYISKYVSKNESLMCGKCWGRSQGITQVKPYSDYALNEIIDRARKDYTEVIQCEQCKVVKTTVFSQLVREVAPVRTYYKEMSELFYNSTIRGI